MGTDPTREVILIVEDEDAIADTLLYALQTEGFEAVWASTCREAEEIFHSRTIDLVLLDILLPDGNGFDLFQHLFRDTHVPVIFLTSRGEEVDRVAGLEMGADDYVVKPFSPREVTARVRAILRRSRSSGAKQDLPAPKGSVPFRIDEKRRRIFYFDQAMNLSRYEFGILNLLIHRPGWVYTRDQILQAAWDEPEECFDRTIDTHIKRIRAEARRIHPGPDPIITHRGVGYALRETW